MDLVSPEMATVGQGTEVGMETMGEDPDGGDGGYRDEGEDDPMDEDREDPNPDGDTNGQEPASSNRRKKRTYY